MKAILSLLFVLLPLQNQELPHAFPREGARQIFDNERVTVWDVTWPKGKPSPMHRHRFDLAGVYLVGSLIRITLPDGTIRESKVDEGYVHFQREGVTHVIFGQSARSRWEMVMRGSTLDKFLSAVPDAAVQVVPLNEVAG